ncbi:MAG: AraC family transcriptional regulator ligand-binding domain-containing protein, partial [Polyangiaceae bacterium]
MSAAIFFARAVAEAVTRSGAELPSWLPFDPARLEQPEGRLDIETFARLLTAAVAASGDGALGLHLAEQVPEGAVDLLGHMAAHASTIREAITLCSRFAPLAMDGLQIDGRDDGGAFVIDYQFPRSTPLADLVLAEFFLGGMVRLARTFTHPDVTPRFAWSEHDRPPHAGEY